MRFHQWTSTRLGKGIVVALVLASSATSMALVRGDGDARVAARAQDRLEATIFSYDGQDFVRTRTTLLTEDGKPAVDTKLDRDTPAYRALTEKRSYTGEATAFGKRYDANYAPLTSEDGRLTGALFVAEPK